MTDRISLFAGRNSAGSFWTGLNLTGWSAPKPHKFKEDSKFQHGNWCIFSSDVAESPYSPQPHSVPLGKFRALSRGVHQVYDQCVSGSTPASILARYCEDPTELQRAFNTLQLIEYSYVVLDEEGNPHLVRSDLLINPNQLAPLDVSNPFFISLIQRVLEGSRGSGGALDGMGVVLAAAKIMREITQSASLINEAADANKIRQETTHQVEDQ